jgi:hypothetical protein
LKKTTPRSDEALNTPGRARTPNLLIRSQVLYPIELPVHAGEVW